MPNFWTWATVAIECFGALAMLTMMQVRTRGATIHSHYGRCLWARRLIYVGTSAVMGWHATHILAEYQRYDGGDFLALFAPIAALTFFGISQIANEQKWLDLLPLHRRDIRDALARG